jgi:hypothetical protein
MNTAKNLSRMQKLHLSFFLFMPISTHLEQRFAGYMIKHPTTPPAMPEKLRNTGLFKALNA